jgi:hypothetical protein
MFEQYSLINELFPVAGFPIMTTLEFDFILWRGNS